MLLETEICQNCSAAGGVTIIVLVCKGSPFIAIAKLRGVEAAPPSGIATLASKDAVYYENLQQLFVCPVTVTIPEPSL